MILSEYIYHEPQENREFSRGEKFRPKDSHWAIKPPSITSSAPVTKDDSSEARYRAP
jgi:hypothetical protein